MAANPKRNKSELEVVITQFSFYASILKLYYAENPIKIEHTDWDIDAIIGSIYRVPTHFA